MCRIVGLWHFGAPCSNPLETVCAMRDTMASGGPDDAGIFIDNSLALGHRRLSVLDLSQAGHQPMSYQQFTIAYNGEIYNFAQIRQELGDNDFIGNSDTEILIRAYAKWGKECVHKLRGMFAFAIWDANKQELFLCRDRVGVKPLYWYFDDATFMFASELKALYANPNFKKSINRESLAEFLSFGYISAPKSIIDNCYKLEPGSFLTINAKKEISKAVYWNPKSYYQHKHNGFNISEFSALLNESFALRMVSDVPVGLFLSGGVDSSLVAASLAKQGFCPETFTIGFNEAMFDESKYAENVAKHLGLKNTKFIFEPNEAKDMLEKLPYVYDEPFGDSSALPTLFLSHQTRKYVKVSLSADGADELFGGYDRYRLALERRAFFSKYRFLEFLLSPISADFAVWALKNSRFAMGKDKFLRIKNSLAAKTLLEQYLVDVSHFRRDDLKDNGLCLEKLKDDYALKNDQESMMLFDFCRYLPDDILTKVDRATSSVGLEGREPFLDHKLVEYAFSMAPETKMPNNEPKGLLKQILCDYLPRELVYRQKKGFGVPLESWFRKELRQMMDELLDDASIEEFFDKKYISALRADFISRRRVDFEKLWYIIVFQMWRKTWKI
jgi:asparagine synthase (glutamine-hydrolysing)